MYRKLDRYGAARLYFEDVIARFPDTEWASYAQYGLGEVLLKQKEWDAALKAFQGVRDGDGDKLLKEQALRKIEWIQNMQKKQDEQSGR